MKPVDAQVLQPEIDDLITLDSLSEFAIMHKLRLRYATDAMYTSVSSVLVSVNPFKQLPLFDDATLRRYLAEQSLFDGKGLTAT